MWSCDPPPATRIVLATLVGLVASALAAPPLALGAAAAGRTLPMRTAALVAATVALLVGTARVEQFDRRVLRSGAFAGTVTVTGQPSADRALASAAGAGETVVLVAPGVALQQGAVYRVSGRLRPLDPVVRGYYATQGAHLELGAARCAMTGRRGGLWGVVDEAHRAALSGMGVGSRSPPPRALVAGVTLGDSGALPTDVRAELRTSGLYHLVAVSGENVALVTVLVLIGLGLAGVVGTPARVSAMIGTGCYVLITGAGPSIVRAGVAGLLVGVAWLISRPVMRWHLLACGAVAVLAFNPLELFDPGFQLSFAAVIAIHVVAPRLRSLFGQAAAVSIACTLVTTPIAWWHFGRIAPLSVPANLLVLPVVGPILWLGLIGSAVGIVAPALAAPLLGLADLLAAYLLRVAQMCS